MPGSLDGFEAVVELASRNLVSAFEAALSGMQGTPPGVREGTIPEQLEQYLLIRNDPNAWAGMINSWIPLIGGPAAVAVAQREAKRLEVLLLRRGFWDGTPEDAGRAAQAGAEAVTTERVYTALEKVMKSVEKVEKAAGTEVIVVPDVVVPDWLSLIQEPQAQGVQLPTPPPNANYGLFPPFTDVGVTSQGEMTGPTQGGISDLVQTDFASSV